jgi:hypothetical protein
MAHGGRREGSGRKPGAVTKRTREIADQALAEGKSPLEVMLENMRHFQQVALDAEAVLAGLTVEEIGGKDMAPEEQFKMLMAKAKNAAGFRQMAQECARDAAPFIHAKLASVTIGGDEESPVTLIHKIERIIVENSADTDSEGIQAAS